MRSDAHQKEIKVLRHPFCKERYPYCGGVRWPAPEKSPDLGNSSPAPRALMYVASLQTSGRHRDHTDDQDESEEAKPGWLQSGLKEWSNYWTFMGEP
jgi:hypothetical protein